MPKTPMGMLREFEDAMGGEQDVYWPPRELLQLRLRLITEEYHETREEFSKAFAGKLDRENFTKELCDVLYVVYGTAVALGIDLDAGLEEVHRSNMSKLGSNGKPILDAGGKVTKGPNYRPPELALAANAVIDENV